MPLDRIRTNKVNRTRFWEALSGKIINNLSLVLQALGNPHLVQQISSSSSPVSSISRIKTNKILDYLRIPCLVPSLPTLSPIFSDLSAPPSSSSSSSRAYGGAIVTPWARIHYSHNPHCPVEPLEAGSDRRIMPQFSNDHRNSNNHNSREYVVVLPGICLTPSFLDSGRKFGLSYTCRPLIFCQIVQRSRTTSFHQIYQIQRPAGWLKTWIRADRVRCLLSFCINTADSTQNTYPGPNSNQQRPSSAKIRRRSDEGPGAHSNSAQSNLILALPRNTSHSEAQELINSTTTIRNDHHLARDLKAKTDVAVQDTIVATRIVDGSRNPQANGAYLKDHAGFPLE